MVFYVDGGKQKTVRERTDFALVNLPTFDAHSGLAKNVHDIDVRMAELTSFFTVFSLNVPIQDIVFAQNLGAALAAGTKDFCLIQNCGHIFYGYDQLSRDLNDALDQCEYMMGHIMDRGGYFYMHDQCLLVNRRAWEKLGKPKFGVPQQGTKELVIPKRSADNVHDDYTPLFLEPTGQKLNLTAQFGYGWNAISEGLAGGMKIVNWPKEVRRAKRHCYAYYGDTAEWVKALSDVFGAPPTQDAQLDRILNFLRSTPDKVGAPKKVFVFNSESDVDIPHLKYKGGIDRAFVLASALKANRILETHGFHAGTEVITYDYSAPALALRKKAIAEWDGRNYGAFFMNAKPQIEAEFAGDVAWIPLPLIKDSETVETEFQREISGVFPSEEQWVAHWARFKALKHHFVEVDVLQDHAGVKTMIDTHAKGNAVLWLSDMFNSPNAIGKLDWFKRKKAFAVVTDTLAANTDSYLLLGGEPRFWVYG